MLQINARSNKYSQIYNWNFKSFSSIEQSFNRYLNFQGYNRYISYDNIAYADLPIRMMERDLKLNFFRVPTDIDEDQKEIIKTYLSNSFNRLNEKDIHIIKGLLETDEQIDTESYEFIDKDLYTELDDDAIKSLFNKCAEQVGARESDRQNTTIIQRYRVFKSKAKHIILILSSYPDTEQASDFFLTYGLLPVLYSDIKEELDPLELDFFKCLVQRSQVKRISNVAPQNAFAALEALQKYEDKVKVIKYKTLFTKLAESRGQIARGKVREAQNYIDDCLRNYDNYLKQLQEASILVDKYDSEKEEIIHEFEIAATTDGVYDINPTGSGAELTFKVPISFFDTEEAELQLKRRPDCLAKDLLTKLFVDEDAKLWIATQATFDFTNNFRDMGSVNEYWLIEHNLMFNPHLQFYHCLGDYKPQLIKAMRDGDLLMFINIALASSKTINFKDGAVISRWFDWLCTEIEEGHSWYTKCKCICKNNEWYSIKEYLTGETEEETTEEPEELEVNEL